jgi:hemolysin activation/secretion protein
MLTAKGGRKWNYWGDREDTGSETKSYSARTKLTLANFVPFQKGLIYVRIAGGSLFSEDASTWEMFRLGGVGTVRGYREEQFVAEQVAWSNLEYRFFLGRSGWFAPFFDLGYYADGTSEWIYGWGIGMALTSKIGIVTIDYGLGREDSFGNGKVHIGALTSF